MGDQGYIGQKLFAQLFDRGLKLVTEIRNNMKNKLMNMSEKLLLKKGLLDLLRKSRKIPENNFGGVKMTRRNHFYSVRSFMELAF